ncbi:hypothetical protein NEF87_004073 [Candidatus Lokiarchaeum ossiferum]|uniref:Acyltransferase 3 domain-containing protein n=1 Tax=Candidatus Lokiarchaeum ossiferum TaxID=2951803 RepID=A0ABY6HW82_9ARCH|nr:hypothetical protein NEF87_004073 [Candidatus Lokiarchaeum sp. B-35]
MNFSLPTNVIDLMENSTLTEPDSALVQTESRKGVRYFQVDAWKALMIAFVIMDHTFTHAFLHDFGSSFWERISIPMLMIIMGFNMGKSFDKKGVTKLKEMYSLSYFENKMKRYVVPFLILYFVHTILYLLESAMVFDTLDVFYYENFLNIFIGYTPFYGPGMWFLPVLMSTILIFPIIYWCYKKNDVITLVGTFVIELGWYLIRDIIYGDMLFGDPAKVTDGFFGCHVFAMFSAVGLGLWFSTDHDILSKRNRFVWIIGLFSIIYIFRYNAIGNWLPWVTGDYHLYFFPYSAVLFLLGMKFIPENPQGKLSDFVRRISKSTYHILLTQIFYFSIVYQFFLFMFNPLDNVPDVFDANPINYLWFYPLNVLITFSIGMLWNEAESRFYRKVKENSSLKLIYKGAIGLSVLFFLTRIVLIVIFFIKY